MIVLFETTCEDGYWSASAIGFSIFTDGETFEELLKNIEEAVLLYFEDEINPDEQIIIETRTTHQVHHIATSSGC
ncbi:MAG: type II toxin-antitoxin system HicB family antitoxin [Methanocalculus sp.]|uniref:type II toxin-antitoxin system HicB family antitoxin n=1 Tax=Methanocalculus sp. TaxID=2004547 RepID=UPI00271EFF34|nr:type II toxin-antitoxin system HicB family antitoxin [Methanocalculus sp.]MDO8840909.1 type II toxin-antitoxin system HicB family antitoxin [Methanocalculus sp.]MDO9538382.1 type II toxin-antitoxin system HicB family antitoxin [Methanocalculus sp.]